MVQKVRFFGSGNIWNELKSICFQSSVDSKQDAYIRGYLERFGVLKELKIVKILS